MLDDKIASTFSFLFLNCNVMLYNNFSKKVRKKCSSHQYSRSLMKVISCCICKVLTSQGLSQLTCHPSLPLFFCSLAASHRELPASPGMRLPLAFCLCSSLFLDFSCLWYVKHVPSGMLDPCVCVQTCFFIACLVPTRRKTLQQQKLFQSGS